MNVVCCLLANLSGWLVYQSMKKRARVDGEVTEMDEVATGLTSLSNKLTWLRGLTPSAPLSDMYLRVIDQVKELAEYFGSFGEEHAPNVGQTKVLALTALVVPRNEIDTRETKITRSEVRDVLSSRTVNISEIARRVALFPSARLIPVDASRGDFGSGYVHQSSDTKAAAKFLVTSGDKSFVLSLVRAVSQTTMSIESAVAYANIYQDIGFHVHPSWSWM
jgi:hypothetical protein